MVTELVQTLPLMMRRPISSERRFVHSILRESSLTISNNISANEF